MTSRRLLILGWKSVVEDALDRVGIPHVTVVEMAKYSRVRSRADENRVLVPCGNIANIESVLSALARSDIRNSEISAVWTADEFSVVVGAALTSVLELQPSLDVDTALRFRDKYLQKQAVAAAGLPVARTALVACSEDLDSSSVSAVGLPAVIKPVAGAGTSLTHRVDTMEELEPLVANLLASDAASGPFLLESFADGHELHLDGCLSQGALTVFSVSRYLTNNLEIQTGGINGSYMLDPERFAAEYSLAQGFALKCLKALGMTEGVFHMEVFRSTDGLSFSECAARAGGGGIIEVFQGKFGLHLLEEHAKVAAGLEPGSPKPSSDAFGCTLLRARPGKALSVPTVAELLAQPGVVEAHVDQQVGDPTPDMTKDTVRRAGSAIVRARNEEELVDRIQNLRGWFMDAVEVAS
ncbi:ATP-grasp domain-containing protein [Streptomyces sp. NPDC058049]|uniref:ATP-grasp domain-containing protein n=1 Tax=Streptomyces sp. NPDC058049 TaxID=3346314 RepID=UPI0036E465E0